MYGTPIHTIYATLPPQHGHAECRPSEAFTHKKPSLGSETSPWDPPIENPNHANKHSHTLDGRYFE